MFVCVHALWLICCLLIFRRFNFKLHSMIRCVQVFVCVSNTHARTRIHQIALWAIALISSFFLNKWLSMQSDYVNFIMHSHFKATRRKATQVNVCILRSECNMMKCWTDLFTIYEFNSQIAFEMNLNHIAESG